MYLFHGSKKWGFDRFRDNSFFSTSARFAAEYGEVREVSLEVSETFNTLDIDHVKWLMNRVGALYDSFNGKLYETLDDYRKELDRGLSNDNWEVFEIHAETIRCMGFDSIAIMEGGTLNFMVFDCSNVYFDHKEIDPEDIPFIPKEIVDLSSMISY